MLFTPSDTSERHQPLFVMENSNTGWDVDRSNQRSIKTFEKQIVNEKWKLLKEKKSLQSHRSNNKQPWSTSLKASCDHSSDRSGLCVFDNHVVPLSMQIMRRSWRVQWPVRTCRFSDTQLSVTYQPSSPVRESDCTYLTSLSPLPPFLPGCPSILGPPWEDASLNPNQVTTMFLYVSVGGRLGEL